MNEREHCQRQIEEMRKRIADEKLENVRAKYALSLKIWQQRAEAIDHIADHRKGRHP